MSDYDFNNYFNKQVYYDYNRLYIVRTTLHNLVNSLAKSKLVIGAAGQLGLPGRLGLVALDSVASELNTSIDAALGQLHDLYTPDVKGMATYWEDTNINYNTNNLGELTGLDNLVKKLARPNIMDRMSQKTLRNLEYFAKTGGKPVPENYKTRFTDFFMKLLVPEEEPESVNYGIMKARNLVPAYASDMVDPSIYGAKK